MAAFERDPGYIFLGVQLKELQLKLDRTSRRLGTQRDALRAQIKDLKAKRAWLSQQSESFFNQSDYGEF
jgi:hypothetical protein